MRTPLPHGIQRHGEMAIRLAWRHKFTEGTAGHSGATMSANPNIMNATLKTGEAEVVFWADLARGQGARRQNRNPFHPSNEKHRGNRQQPSGGTTQLLFGLKLVLHLLGEMDSFNVKTLVNSATNMIFNVI